MFLCSNRGGNNCHPSVDAVSCRVVIHGLVSFSHGRRNADDFCSNRFLRESPGVGSHRVGTRRAQSEGETPRNVVVPSNAAEWRPRKEKNAAFEYPLADRPLRRSRYGRCARKPMGKKSAAAIHRLSCRQKSSTADEQRGAAKVQRSK